MRYKVIKVGFFDGKLKKVGSFINPEKPFTKENMPSWVEPCKPETAKEARARQKATNAAVQKKKDDDAAVKESDFMGSDAPAAGSNVESL